MEELERELGAPESVAHKALRTYVGPILQELNLPPNHDGGWEACKAHVKRIASLGSLKGGGDMRWMAVYDGPQSLLKVRHGLACATHLAIIMSNATPYQLKSEAAASQDATLTQLFEKNGHSLMVGAQLLGHEALLSKCAMLVDIFRDFRLSHGWNIKQVYSNTGSSFDLSISMHSKQASFAWMKDLRCALHNANPDVARLRKWRVLSGSLVVHQRLKHRTGEVCESIHGVADSLPYSLDRGSVPSRGAS